MGRLPLCGRLCLAGCCTYVFNWGEAFNAPQSPNLENNVSYAKIPSKQATSRYQLTSSFRDVYAAYYSSKAARD